MSNYTRPVPFMNYDPYQTPSASAVPPPLPASGQISEPAVRELLGTQGWVRFISVLMLVATGFALLSLILEIITPGSTGRFDRSSTSQMSGPYGGGNVAGQLLALFIVALLYLYPSILLSRYASAIKRFRHGRSMADLEAALRHQRFFWRFIGIISCVVLVVMIVAMIAGFGAAFLGRGRL